MEFSIRMFLPNGAGPQALQRSRCFLEATGCYGSPQNSGQDSGQFDPNFTTSDLQNSTDLTDDSDIIISDIFIYLILCDISDIFTPVSNEIQWFPHKNGPGALTPWMPFTVPLLCAPIRSTTLRPA